LIKNFDILIEKEDTDQKIMNDIIQTFKNLRVFSINIVNHFTKIREISSYGVIGGKYDFDGTKIINYFDKNYMLKMKNDTDFLYSSNLNRYFNFSMDSDPFLISLSDTKVNEKVSVPLSEEMLQSIRLSQFLLLQELIFYEVNRTNNKLEDILMPPRITSSHKRKKDILKPIPITKSPDIRNSYINKIKPLSQQIIKKDVCSIRSNHKELITKDLNDELASEKGKYDTVEIKDRRKKGMYSVKSKNDIMHTPNHDISMISTKSKNTTKIEKLIIDDSKVINQTDYNLHKPNVNNTEIYELKHTESDLLEIVSQKPLDDSIERQSKLNEAAVQELQYNIATHDIEDFDNTKMSFKFYTDNIAKFSGTYVEYLTHINEEQKVIYKISNKLLDNLKGISPKLILINYNNQLIGLSVVYYNYSNESNIRLVLSHFSTVYFTHYYAILLDLIEFLKLNFIFHEIFLELYYGYKDEKYSINPHISEIIAKKMKFKWITLENSGVDRKVKYRLPNPKCEANEMDLYSFSLKFVVAMSLQDKINSPGSVRYTDKESDINLFPFLYVLSEMSNQNDYTVSTEGFNVFNSDKLRVSIT
jgi:hypothetical protein